MWLSQAHGGMPVRIKITQVSGNFIDMEMRDVESLPALPSWKNLQQPYLK